jgi:hypothetical protein
VLQRGQRELLRVLQDEDRLPERERVLHAVSSEENRS